MTGIPTEEFPAIAKDFYRRRDHRTNAYNEVHARYADNIVRVTADSEALASLPGQVMFLTSCNLLSRWCRQVAITIDDLALHSRLRGEGWLVSHCIAMMQDADPFGQFMTDVPDRHDLHIHIGERPPEIQARSTVLTCADWLAGVRRPRDAGLRMRPSDNPIGAAFAAVLGGAQVFRDALDRGELFPAGFTFDAFTGMPASPDAISARTLPADPMVGRALITGAGSVSSA